MQRLPTLILTVLFTSTILVSQTHENLTLENIEKEKILQVKKNLPEMENKEDYPSPPGRYLDALDEGFEDSFPPPGWTYVTNDTAGRWERTTSFAHSGQYSAVEWSDSVTYPYSSWLITPKLVISSGNSTLQFWQSGFGTAYFYYHGLWVDTTASTDTANYFEVDSMAKPNEANWTIKYKYLSAYMNDTIRLAFHLLSPGPDLCWWFIDDVTGVNYINPTDTLGPSVSLLDYPNDHFADGLADSVLAGITDANGVDTAITYYTTDAGTTWVDIGMSQVGTDSFLGEIPSHPRGTEIYYYVEARDIYGQPSQSSTEYFSIYPTSENLIVTENSSMPNLIYAFYSLGYDFDYLEPDTMALYEDSVAALWKKLWYGAQAPIDSVRALRKFLEYPSVTDSADRHALFIGGASVAQYTNNGSRDFIQDYFKCEYIYDDPTSSDFDDIVEIPGDPISDGMPTYTMYTNTSNPDFVLTNARLHGDSIGRSHPFQYISGANVSNTPGGIRYNGLTYLGAYFNYSTTQFLNAPDRDTLIKRIMKYFNTAGMPDFVDAARHTFPAHEYGTAGDSVLFTGYAVEPGASSSDIIAQFGLGPQGSYPMEDTLWLWSDVDFDSWVSDTFYFGERIVLPDTTVLPTGNYSIAFRFSYNQGPWIYADMDGFERGFDYQFDPAMAGTLTVIKSWTYPDVRINEVLYDTEGGDDSLFTELKGPPGSSLDNFTLAGINGYDGSVYRTIDLSGNTIKADSFFVISTVDLPFADTIADVDWQNGDDNIQLHYAGNVIDALGYGSYDTTSWHFMGEGMPAPDVAEGHALHRDPSDDDNNNIKDFAGSGALSPGAPNPGFAYTTISDIQGMGAFTPYEDTLVTATGLVTAASNWGLFLQDSDGPWNGIFVDRWQDYPVAAGDSIEFLASPIEDYSETKLVDRSFVANFGQATGEISPYTTTCGDVDTNEALEGVLVELNMVTVIDTSLSYGEWTVTDGSDTCTLDDYYSYTEPGEGEVISILRGPVAYTYGAYKIEPRGDWDILSFDMVVDSAYSPDTVSLDSSLTPYAMVLNAGDDLNDSASVYFEVDSMSTVIHADTQKIMVNAGMMDTVNFSDWTPGFTGNITLRYEVYKEYDVNTGNDRYEHSVFLSGIEVSEAPKVFSLSVPGITAGQNRIKYAVPEEANVSINLFDKLGRRAAVLVNGRKAPGYYEVDMNRLNLPTGVYFVSMKSKSFQDLKKVVLLK